MFCFHGEKNKRLTLLKAQFHEKSKKKNQEQTDLIQQDCE